MAGQVTETDLVHALLEALESTQVPERPPGAMRTAEIKEALGIGERRLRRLLKSAKKRGLIKVCHDIPHVDLLDRATMVRGWQLVKDEES